jgi:acyl-CoA synthetase (AMP-forming)/AMP-acid ligase II
MASIQSWVSPGVTELNVYRRLKSKVFDRLMLALRSKRGGMCVEKQRILREMVRMRAEKKPVTVGLLSDQKPRPEVTRTWTEFLHQETGWLDGGEVLGKKFGYPVVYLYIRRVRRGYYDVDLRVLAADPKQTGEGEIVVKGDNVMRGYYKDYERTLSVFTEDGWFRTGDVATVDKKGRYSIKGRLGSVILGPSGENIYPEEIESVINDINDINESLVVERNGHLVALVHFNDDVLNWSYENEDRFVEEMDRRKEEILKFVNERVNRSSRISDVEVEKEPFIKTATLKIKRFLYKEKKEDESPKQDKS